jgi:tetratricopeptide (TPR) repeat protein
VQRLYIPKIMTKNSYPLQYCLTPYTPPMTEDTRVQNDRALQQLAWAIEASVGKFKLILARCNYVNSRSQLIERLCKLCQVEIRVLVLREFDTTLYTAIREELQDEVPACLMVLGLEAVENLQQTLISANQVREEFRNHFRFPLIFWIDDEVHKQFMQVAPDLESWATTKTFAVSQQEVASHFQEIAEQFFSNTPRRSKDDDLSLESELEAAQRDLQDDSILTQELKANLESLLGFAKKVNNKIDDSIEHYRKALELWRELNNLERTGKVLEEISICYYSKAFKNQDINHKDWEEPKFYLQQYIQFIIQNQCLEFIPNAIARFGEIIQELPECEQLEKLVKQTLELYKVENKPVELARNYGFLAEVALKQGRWEEARNLAQKALDTLAAIPNLTSFNLSSELSELPTKVIVTNDSGFYRFLQARSQCHLGQHKEAIQNFEAAIKESNPQVNLRIYLKILHFLHELYFEQREYIKAYDIGSSVLVMLK